MTKLKFLLELSHHDNFLSYHLIFSILLADDHRHTYAFIDADFGGGGGKYFYANF